MNATCNARGPCATLTPKRAARRVVLAGRFALAAALAEHFHKHGWDVRRVADGDVYAAAAEADPHALLLPEAGGDESGYLACAKLLQTAPALKVIVIGAARTPARERFAAFVGAGFVTEADGVARLVDAVG